MVKTRFSPTFFGPPEKRPKTRKKEALSPPLSGPPNGKSEKGKEDAPSCSSRRPTRGRRGNSFFLPSPGAALSDGLPGRTALCPSGPEES